MTIKYIEYNIPGCNYNILLPRIISYTQPICIIHPTKYIHPFAHNTQAPNEYGRENNLGHLSECAAEFHSAHWICCCRTCVLRISCNTISSIFKYGIVVSNAWCMQTCMYVCMCFLVTLPMLPIHKWSMQCIKWKSVDD